jgi:hypothetical protein
MRPTLVVVATTLKTLSNTRGISTKYVNRSEVKVL